MTTLLFHINSLLDGGIEKVLIELLCGLNPQQYRIILSVAHHLPELEVLKAQIPPYVEIRYILDKPILTATKQKKIQKKISVAGKLFEELVLPPFKKMVHRQKLRQWAQEADVVIDFDMTLAPFVHLFTNKRTVAYCHFSLGHYWDGKKHKLDRLVNRLVQYNKVVMLCDEMKEKATQLYPALQGNVVRIYNAVDFSRIATLATEDLGAFAYLENTGYLLSAGRLSESQKDFTMLIKGYAAAVKEQGFPLPLVIVGDGYSRKALEQLAADLGLKDKVIFAGFQHNPYKWMARADMFAFCSKYEGLPTVLIEALSLGRPLIATETPTGIAEILMHGKCGTLVPMGNVPALANAITDLYGNDAKQQAYRQASQSILHQFRIENMVGTFNEMIANLRATA